jgi:uncharacterized protein (TIGR00725 family)
VIVTNKHLNENPVIIGVIGSNVPSETSLRLAEDLGKALIDQGYFIVTGGLGGIMESVSKGGRSSLKHHEGKIIGIIPTTNKNDANEFVDIIIPTGMGHARNILVVSTSDIVVAIEGGAGTLSEIAIAWQLQKPIIALSTSGGWSKKLAGKKIDQRRRTGIRDARTVREVLVHIGKIIPPASF